jgi:hypothetical protein
MAASMTEVLGPLRAGRVSDSRWTPLATASCMSASASSRRQRAAAVERSWGVVWLEPRAMAEVQYNEIMQVRLRDPVLRSVEFFVCGVNRLVREGAVEFGGITSWGRSVAGSARI